MKKITAYKCGYCKKILETHSGISKHEKKCFRNPKTKSCITCKNLTPELYFDGVKITEKQREVLDFKVPGTFFLWCDTDPDSDGFEFPILNKEHQYLYEYTIENHCSERNMLLNKLCTNCDFYKELTH